MYFTRNTKSNYRENDKFFAKRFTLLLKIESFYPQKIRQNTNTGKNNVSRYSILTKLCRKDHSIYKYFKVFC